MIAALRWGVTACLAAALLLLAGAGVVVPAITGSTTHTILTASMEPALPPGTLIAVRPVPVGDIRIGDVVTYQLHSGEPETVTHRVQRILISEDGTRRFVTLGDNNAVPDRSPVTTDQIIGRVWYAVPWIGWVATLRSSHIGVLVTSIACAGLFAYGAWNLVQWARSPARRERESAPTPPG